MMEEEKAIWDRAEIGKITLIVKLSIYRGLDRVIVKSDEISTIVNYAVETLSIHFSMEYFPCHHQYRLS